MAGDSIDNLLKFVTVIQTLRSVMATGPESTIATHEQFEKRGEAARSNAINVAIGLTALVLGVGIHLCGWMLASGYPFTLKGIVIGIPLCLFLAILPAIGTVARFAYKDASGQMVYPIAFKWAYLAVLVVVAAVSFATLAVMNYEVKPWETYAGLGLAAIGPVGCIAGWLLAYNGAQNLKKPYGWRSPAEEEIQKPMAEAAADIMRRMLGAEPAPSPVIIRAIPTHSNGRRGVVTSHGAADTEGQTWQPDPEQHNLVFLGLLAAGTESLAYGPLLVRNLTLPGIEPKWEEPRTLNKETLAVLLTRGAEWGWWELRGPRRKANLLFDTWEDLYRAAADLWEELTDGLLSLPDPFGGNYQINPVVPFPYPRAA